MDTKEMINYLTDLVEQACKRPTNEFGYGIWTHHIVEVVRHGKVLAQKLGADEEIVEIAALLHDYGSIIDYRNYPDHHNNGADIAEDLLRSLGYPEEKIQQVKLCIVEHRGSVLIDKSSIESICVSSADAMAHIGQVPSLLHLAYVRRGLSVEDGAAWVGKKITRSFEKLCPEAKELMRKSYREAMSTLGYN